MGGCLSSRSSVNGCFEVCQNKQAVQEVGGASGIGAELGEDPPVLEVGEAVLDRCAADGEDPVGGLPAGGELAGTAGAEAGDDHGIAYVISSARNRFAAFAHTGTA
ncbi:hypothetical protein SAMN05216505_11298 [Streptomyces prasinopilosus]|uniref:Uncharacterized protein n=1 Tax=Streptomyces prasinopilosus TaxID=67344 RepID=A0A1G6XWB4_9ACTN|nr:hypothetical protein SAMN05216505_11298 [Streptomyces prasinopilosus]